MSVRWPSQGDVTEADLTAALALKQSVSEKGEASGYAALDASGRVLDGSGLPVGSTSQFFAPAPSGGDDTAALQAVFDAVPAKGGEVVLAAGVYSVPNGGVNTGNATRVRGMGAGKITSNSGTVITCSSATADCFTVPGAGVTLEDFTILNTAAALDASTGLPTAGTGMRFTNGAHCRVYRCAVVGFYNNIRFDAGNYYSLKSSTFVDAVNFDVYLTHAARPDHGDHSIEDCLLGNLSSTRATVAALCWESGGGLRFVDNKINERTYPSQTDHKIQTGLLIRPADGVTTSVFVIADNSIEGCSLAGIDIQHKGPLNTGKISKISITGNELGVITAATTGTAIKIISSNASATFDNVSISGNVFGHVHTPMTFGFVAGLSVGVNTVKNINGSQIVLIGNVCTDMRIEPQVVSIDNVTLLDNPNLTSSSNGPHSQARYSLHREIPAISSAVTYSPLWKFEVPNFGAGTVRLTLAGNISGVGSFVYDALVTFTRASAAVTAAVVGTPVTAGGSLDIQYDTATQSGWVHIKARLVSGTTVGGVADLQLTGPIRRLKKGN